MTILTFAELWDRSFKTGRKELYAKKWFNLPTALKIRYSDRIREIKGKIIIEEYLK